MTDFFLHLAEFLAVADAMARFQKAFRHWQRDQFDCHCPLTLRRPAPGLARFAHDMQPLFEKLAHPLPDVRRRALRSLLFKQQHGLLAVTESDLTAALPPLLVCLDLCCGVSATAGAPCSAAAPSSDPAADAMAALELLSALLSQLTGAAGELMQLGADQVLIRMADGMPACAGPATALLGELLCRRGQAAPSPRPSGGEAFEKTASTAAHAAAVWAAPCGPAALSTAVVHVPPQPPLSWGGRTELSTPRLSRPLLPWSLELAAESSPAAAFTVPGTPLDPLAGCIQRGAAAARLSDEDSQQLFEVALELGADSADEAALLAALAMLRYGVLQDMPAAAVAGEPALVHSLLGLLGRGGRVQPRVVAAALQVLQELAGALGATAQNADDLGADQQAESDGSTAAALAHAGLMHCAALCSEEGLRHEALQAAAALLPLLRIAPPSGSGPSARSLAQLLGALTDSLRLSLVADCTGADVAPPANWAAGFHLLVLGPGSSGILQLVAGVLERLPESSLAQALPPLLCDILAALAINPVAATAAPDLHALALRCLPHLRPAAAAELQAVSNLRGQQEGFLAAVQQLTRAPSAALAAACCRQVQQQHMAALALLPQPGCQQAVEAIVQAVSRCARVPAAGALVASLLLHCQPDVRKAALAAAARLAGGGAALVAQPAVAGSLVLALSDEPGSQQLAAALLQAAASAAPDECGKALLPWEAWLECCTSLPGVGPAAATALQVAAQHKRSTWQHVTPVLLALFHASPGVASAAASQLHMLLVQQRPATSGSMLFNPLPFDGMLAQAGAPCPPGADFYGTSKAAAAAAKLFTAADVQSLLTVIGNRALPPELTAAALGQLAQVASDPRFSAILVDTAVLGQLFPHAMDSTSLHRTQQPALDCLVLLLEHQQAAVAQWLLAEADSRVVPLLPLVFHPLPMARQAAARLLHLLLFGAAARQLEGLQVHGGIAQSTTCGSGRQPDATHTSKWCASQGVPEPFCASYRFPYPASVLPVWRPAAQLDSTAVFGSDEVERLWRAQQICAAAAAGGGGLLELLTAAEPGHPQWELDFVRATLATLRGLQSAEVASECLSALAASQDHQHCHAALCRLKLLAVAVPKGLDAMAASPWQDSLRFLLASAPLSTEDCWLWLEMLPLLKQLLGAAGVSQQGQPVPPLLLCLAEQFVGGSALAWAQQLGSQAASSHMQAALLPLVLHAVCQVACLGMATGSGSSLCQLLEVMRSREWLVLLCQQLPQQGSYAGRVAALHLASTLVDCHVRCASGSLEAGPLLASVVRHVLMPKHLWGTQQHHGKAAVHEALHLLHLLMQAAPAQDWAAAWTELGTTYWLSRAAGDSSPLLRTAALRLVAAAVAVPATRSLLQQAWPECSTVAVEAVVDSGQPVDVRAAALTVVAAAMSHGLTPHPGAAAGQPAVGSVLAAEADGEGGDGGTEAVAADNEGDNDIMGSLPSINQLALLPQPVCPLSAEAFLQQAQLWSSVRSTLQEAEDLHLLSAAAHAALQCMLLDFEGAAQVVDSGVLLRLLGLPAAAAAAPGSTKAASDVCTAAVTLRDSVEAARAAAAMLVVMCQLGCPASLSPDLLPAATAAFSTVAAYSCASPSGLPEAAAESVQRVCWGAMPDLADATALLLQAGSAGCDQAQAACSCQPLPLAFAVAVAMAGPVQGSGCPPGLVAACCRLLAVVLQQKETADAFLLGPSGTEHQPGPFSAGSGSGIGDGQPVGAVLCTFLVELLATWLAAVAHSTQHAAQQQQQQQQQQQLVLSAALGGLLAHSQSAKGVALDVGLHTMLLDQCGGLAGGAGEGPRAAAHCPAAAAASAPSASAHPAAAAAAVSRASKLQQLKQQRGVGRLARPAAQLAFGSRAPSASKENGGSGREQQEQQQPREQKQQAQVSIAARCFGSEPAALGSGDGSSSRQQAGSKQQALLLRLSLLQQLAVNSIASCDALAAAGLLGVACQLLEPGTAVAVQHSMLALLSCVFGNSQQARHACSTTGAPPLLEQLLAMLLSSSTQLSSAGAAASTLSSFAATPDGARALIHTTGLPQRALRHLQDCVAGKDWRRLLPTLQVLADLGAQPEGQRALLRCSVPSGDMLTTLVDLAGQQQPSTPPAAAEAAMLVLRQLALHPDAKAHLAGKAGALQGLLSAVGAAAGQAGRAAAAAHALWALVYGSGGERVKVALRRCDRCAESIQAGLAACDREQHTSWAIPLRQACDALQRLLA